MISQILEQSGEVLHRIRLMSLVLHPR
jgi:hypothetical protein